MRVPRRAGLLGLDGSARRRCGGRNRRRRGRGEREGRAPRRLRLVRRACSATRGRRRRAWSGRTGSACRSRRSASPRPPRPRPRRPPPAAASDSARTAGRRLLRHERAGDGRRRARHREDGRRDALRRRERPPERGRRAAVRSRACSTRCRSTPAASHELLLYGDRLLVLSRGGYWVEPLPAMAASIRPYAPSQSVMSEIDVSNPAKLRLVRTLTLDGAYVAARLVGGTARIVVVVAGAGGAAVRAAAELDRLGARRARRSGTATVVASSGVAKWLPDVPDQASGRRGLEGAPARPVPQRAPAGVVLGPRHADRAHGRPRQGPRARSTRSP